MICPPCRVQEHKVCANLAVYDIVSDSYTLRQNALTTQCDCQHAETGSAINRQALPKPENPVTLEP